MYISWEIDRKAQFIMKVTPLLKTRYTGINTACITIDLLLIARYAGFSIPLDPYM